MLQRLIKNSKDFIRDEFERTGRKGFVLGLSGGLDSAVVLKLVVDTVGSENIFCMIMPTIDNKNTEDAIGLAVKLGVEYDVINIRKIVDSFFFDNILSFKKVSKEEHNLRYGNVASRVRMTKLYDKAMELGRLVIGTNNLSEWCTGYFTKWGDGVSDLEPIMNFTKTELFKVAELIGLPQIFYTKEPTADLWEGQNDEEEMGYSYEYVDKLIIEYVSCINYYSFSKFLEERDEKGFLRDRYKVIRHKIWSIPQCRRTPTAMQEWIDDMRKEDVGE